uniref:Reverse transcriptase N-terminal domain-containing protein n=1 Tax=Apophlaea sinclairii TaxID=212746 RepID=A0A1C9CBJ0_9FLOR|nr:hypothetical protein Apop_056 [Apophlaea sinclairii]AOM65746.1 hypothetical protein Apop_056 [Apophlaea sinclairii]
MTEVVNSNKLITCSSFLDISTKTFTHELKSLQKRIYKATVRYDYKLVHKLQKLLITSKSIQLIVILNAINSCKTNYCIKGNRDLKLQFNDKTTLTNKFKVTKLFKLLTDNIIITNLSHKVKSNLIYLCLKPEWEAKFVNNYIISNTTNNLKSNIKTVWQICSKHSRKCTEKYNKIYILKNKVNLLYDVQHLNYMYLRNKLNTSNTINKLVKSYLTFLFDKFYSKKDGTHNKKISSFFPYLLYLIKTILIESLATEICLNSNLLMNVKHKYNKPTIFPRLIWDNNSFLFFCNSKSEIILIQKKVLRLLKYFGLRFSYKDITISDASHGFNYFHSYIKLNYYNNKNLVIQPSMQSQVILIKQIKNSLYHKDKLNRTRANTYLSFQSGIKKVNCLVQQWKKYYYRLIIINNYTHKQLMKTIQAILYNWHRKKARKQSLKQIKQSFYQQIKIPNLIYHTQ